MKIFKKIMIILAAAVLFSAAGCKKNISSDKNAKPRIKVVATIFPIYDWIRNIAAGTENISVELLVKNGVDLHSYQSGADDIIKISTCDVLVFAGGESDGWIKTVLENPAAKNVKAVNLMDVLSENVKEEEIVEGMTINEVVSTDSATGEEGSIEETDVASDSEEDEVEYDEHVWLGVENARLCAEYIAEILSELDTAEAETIKNNFSDYSKKLAELVFMEKSCGKKTIIVADRFPFRYLVDEIGISYSAAFAGCSAETEASFETIAFLSDKLKELKADCVYVTESSDKKLAKTVINNAGFTENECKIVVLNSMQNVTLEQAENGSSYVEFMKKNLEELK